QAVAKSQTHLVSDYQSEESQFFDPRIQFKFSINGRDNEMPYNTDHRANIYPTGADSVVLLVTFGEQAELRSSMPSDESLPPNTKVTFKLDFNPVLKAFEEKGYYEDPRGEKVYADDFKGIYIAGSAHPLSWDFENLANNSDARLTDKDGDGIYEITLEFNDYDPSAHVSSEWKLQNDIDKYPRFISEKPILNAIYNMSLDEMVMLQEEDSTFRTGKEWSGVWTRDISYSVYLSLAMLEPEICKTSLMRKVKNNRIIQDTGTGGAWPVSSDREVWSLAAWEIYKFTGDREWLKQAYEIISNSIRDDEKTVYNAEYGLFSGESSFLDWRKQTYPLWMEPTDIYASLNLGTNMVFYQTLNILDQMGDELDLEETLWEQKAQKLKESINEYFWTPEGYYGQYLYGDRYLSLSPKAETLGEALSIIFDVADDARKSQILANVPNLEYGTPCIYPQIPNIPPYHNNGIWPFVQAYWTLAAAKDQHIQLVEYGYGSILRQAALFLTNKENFVAETGDFAGTEINSDRQQWSVAGQLAMNYRVLFGMQLGVDHLAFHPVIPEPFEDNYHLDGFKYRDAVLNITVEGFGDGIESFYLNGELQDEHKVEADLTGQHDVRIVMNEVVKDKPLNLAEFRVSPETPEVSIEGDSLKWQAVGGAAKYQIVRNGELVSETEELSYWLPADQKQGEYQVMAIDEKGSQSFLSEPVVVDVKDKLVLEAEDFYRMAENDNAGYSGSGYIDFTKANNATLDFQTTIPESGEWFISFRYANGSGPVNTDNKCAIRSLFVNDQFASSVVFPQRGTNEWANWGITNTIPLTLKKGINQFEIDFEPFNENMNGEVNRFMLDQ
ncbi:alpha-L-rhamnosidase-related protein, partial [Marinilabilia sp.]